MHLYKKRGTTDRVAIRRNASHDPQYARTVLRQAGMDEAGIERFIAETDRRTH